MVIFCRVRPQLATLLVLAVISSLTGCSGSEDVFGVPPLGTVRGIVTLDGKPLANASVEFLIPSSRSSIGQTDSNGAYELNYDASNKGAAVGQHTVAIRTKILAEVPETVPAKYNDRTELKAEVAEGDNEFDFQLKSK